MGHRPRLCGNNEETIPLVRGADGRSRHAIPPRIKPARGQIPEYGIHAPSEQRGNVFHDDVNGSKLANDAGEFGPQPGALAREPRFCAGERDVLAGEPAANDVDPRRRGGDFFDIAEPVGVGPVLREHPPTVGVYLRLPQDGPVPGALKPEFQPAYSAEQ